MALTSLSIPELMSGVVSVVTNVSADNQNPPTSTTSSGGVTQAKAARMAKAMQAQANAQADNGTPVPQMFVVASENASIADAEIVGSPNKDPNSNLTTLTYKILGKKQGTTNINFTAKGSEADPGANLQMEIIVLPGVGLPTLTNQSVFFSKIGDKAESVGDLRGAVAKSMLCETPKGHESYLKTTQKGDRNLTIEFECLKRPPFTYADPQETIVVPAIFTMADSYSVGEYRREVTIRIDKETDPTIDKQAIIWRDTRNNNQPNNDGAITFDFKGASNVEIIAKVEAVLPPNVMNGAEVITNYNDYFALQVIQATKQQDANTKLWSVTNPAKIVTSVHRQPAKNPDPNGVNQNDGKDLTAEVSIYLKNTKNEILKEFKVALTILKASA